MKLKITEDLKVCSNKNILKAISIVLFSSSFRAILNYRIAHFFYKVKLIPICKFIMMWNRIIHSVDIDYRAELDGGFVLIHGIGVVIGKDVKTKGHVKIYQGVTLGGNNGKERMHEKYGKMTQPILEDNATVYTNACVFGPVVINKGATVGSACVCTRDIPENHIYYNKVEHTLKEI